MREGQLKEYILYNGDVILQFDEEAHEYFYDGNLVPSTTKIIDETLAKHALKFWAVNITLEWLKKQIRPGNRITTTELEAIMKGAKFVHLRESERATTIGSNVHSWIEEFVNYVLANGADETIEEIVSKITTPLRTVDAINSANSFINWYVQNEVEFVASEQKVYSRKYNYSGTFDLLAYVNGALSIVDFKTSKHIYPDYLVQGSGYWNAYEEEQEYIFETIPNKVEQFVVLRLPKDGSEWETMTISSKDDHFKIFEMARQIFDWLYKDFNNINPKKVTSSMDTVQYL